MSSDNDSDSQTNLSPKRTAASRPSSSHKSHMKSAKKLVPTQTTTTNQDIFVYIPDLPTNCLDDKLQDKLQTCIEKTGRMTVKNVECYLKLGVAVVELIKKEDQIYLLSAGQSMIFDKERGVTISFVDALDFDSYIVLDQGMTKIPSGKEISRRYMQEYKIPDEYICEPISIQFPNIFRISLTNLDELIAAADMPDFKIGNTFAHVYPHADCSFFEDLPSNTNNDKVMNAVAVQLGESKLPSIAFYIQHNKKTNNAVVLGTKSSKKWMSQGFIVLDGRNLTKKTKLAYRVTVSNVPHGFNTNRIVQNPVFAGQVLNHCLIDDHLVIELDSLDSYNKCLEIGALAVDNVVMGIKPHTVDNNPDQCEITAENWYETAMHDAVPDITSIINNPQHPILHYKWNAQNWIDQFKKAKQQRNQNSKYDRVLHLLRVTVMLNTIAVLRKKKYIVDGNEVTLDLRGLKTIGYDHRSKLFDGKTIMQDEFKTPFKSTTVRVVNEDCLVLYEKLISNGYRPLLLNMANATSPGGGYRKGDGAQEENLFRRSDYYQSLDREIADKEQSEPLYCNGKGQIRKPTGYNGFYPMEMFGAIYTSGITVFRHREEEEGYAYMAKPLSNVCSLAMAAFRDPELNKNHMLEDKFAVNTHKKIENIFAIGHHQNHDCLVLSALGCGAFKNPPEHIALLFKSVITQYAGYFDKIYFAIIDDHNVGNKMNPNGNFAPFQRLLDNQVFYPPKTLRLNGVTGPYSILSKSSDGKLTLSDGRILYKSPCHHGTKCHDIKNTQHCNEFSHPPVCSHQSTESPCEQMNDEVHKFTFHHNSKCKHGGVCTVNDPQHLNEYDHPDVCKDGNNCKNTNSDHLFACRHLPICRYGVKCVEYLKGHQDHCAAYRHCKLICPHDNCCVRFHDKEHIEDTIHSFRTPCPFTPYNCPKYVTYTQLRSGEKLDPEVEKHCLQHSHVCLFGRQCKTKDLSHFLTSIHIARHLCSQEDKCTNLTDEEHLESFTHPDIRDIRLFCKHPGFECRQRLEQDHLKKFRHGKNHNHLTVAPSSNFNASINFVHNQGDIIRNLNTYIDASGWKKATISREILNWIRALQPVHRCSPHIFESILVLGHVMSINYMELLKKPKHVAKAVMQHSRIRRILLAHNIPEVKQNIYELIHLLVLAEFAKTGADGIAPVDADHAYHVNIVERKLRPPLSDRDIQAIHRWATKIADASIKLSKNPPGIKYPVDKKLGTNNHVFSILGPHHGSYYGDIVITFKQEIMFHTDANFSFQAGTGFPSMKIYGHRPWWKDPGTEDKRVEHFHNIKLHCSVPRYEHAAAAELVAVCGMNRKSMDIDLDTVIQQWTSVDSHFVFESHLPQLIPLDYIDNVYMPKNLFQSLSDEAKQSARAVFGSSMILTDHAIDLSLIVPGNLVPQDATRKPYLNFVIEKNLEKIKERMDRPQISRGIVITVPGTKFDSQTVIPITISQSYRLYCLDKSQAPSHPEYTYIYWQAMNGDMMLTLSNETIQSADKDQTNLRYLICYVAEKPSQDTGDYHETYSYLNDDHPFQHYNNMHKGRFKAKSNVFYRGCNTDDFFTFCLKITHKTNEATLSHAGPNGIYNHTKIHYQFDKSTLDLSRLNYIHVSGGSQDVAIRNLIIRHEQVPQLHPTFDKDFTVNTSEVIKQRRASIDYIPVVGGHGGEQRKKRETSEPPPMRHTAPVESSPPVSKPSIFRRIKTAIFGRSKRDIPPIPIVPHSNLSASEQTRYNSSRPVARKRSSSPPPKKSTYNPSPPAARKRSPTSTASVKLPACQDSIYCLQLGRKDHTDKYSHQCRFNELCRNKDKEPHLVHEQHNVPKCSKDSSCSKLTDPIHRAEYRHTGKPDYLYPCRDQETCSNNSTEHRIKYFHGEEIPSFKKNKTSSSRAIPKSRLTPCRYGDKCRSTKDPQHMAKYSHPT
ncbi:hypothetical protein I4U23_011751 [Adineta vaga]|nr:hypothetical protein I4U23_011751 [Adineta vaga]